jgi:hypothetical protein
MTHWAALKMARCQTDIARHLFAIVKRRAEHFANECGSKFWPGALELDQILFDVDRLRSAIKNVPPVAGSHGIYLRGGRGFEEMEKRSRAGRPVGARD